MITILYFIGLKLLEIAVIMLSLWVLYFIGYGFLREKDEGLSGVKVIRIIVGFVVVAGSALVGWLLRQAIIMNWEWAVKLSQ